GVQGVRRPHRGGAALDVVHVGALVGDDQRPLELAHVLGVDPEVGLQRHLDVHARRHVDERAARPHGAVERGELVVVGRDHRREVLAHEVLVLAQARVHVHEHDALLLDVLAHLVVDDLGLVLGAHAGEELALRLGDAQLVEGALDLLRHVVPRLRGLLGGAHEVVDGVVVDLSQHRRAPGGLRLGEEVLERLQAELAHPLRLVLELGDLLHEALREALGRLEGVARLLVVEPELLLVVGIDADQRLLLGDHLRCGHGQSTSSLMTPSSIATGNVSTGTYAGSVRGFPVRRSKREPWRGHSTVQGSWSNSPWTRSPSSWEQRSSIASSVPPQLKTPISRSSHSTSLRSPGGSSSRRQMSITGLKSDLRSRYWSLARPGTVPGVLDVHTLDDGGQPPEATAERLVNWVPPRPPGRPPRPPPRCAPPPPRPPPL